MKEIKADYVIVGAGTAGCVLSARLSENPHASVLLLEAGAEDRHPYIHVPAGFVRLLEHPLVTWRSRTRPHGDTGQRELVFPRGRGLGGSSSINGLLYMRPFTHNIQRVGALPPRPGWDFRPIGRPLLTPGPGKLENLGHLFPRAPAKGREPIPGFRRRCTRTPPRKGGPQRVLFSPPGGRGPPGYLIFFEGDPKVSQKPLPGALGFFPLYT